MEIARQISSNLVVFESIIGRFQMVYSPTEHMTTDEQLVVFRDKCPFHMAMKSKTVKYGIKMWVAAVAKKFHAYDMQVYTGKTDRAREKNKGLWVVKGLSHVRNQKRCYC
jgi:hypothetical protein